MQKIREARGFSLSYVASEVGVTEQAVRKWENSTEPSTVLAFALCDVLEIDLSELVKERRR